jgi:hypothetical protein
MVGGCGWELLFERLNHVCSHTPPSPLSHQLQGGNCSDALCSSGRGVGHTAALHAPHSARKAAAHADVAPAERQGC